MQIIPSIKILPAPYCISGKHAALKRPKLESEDRRQAGVMHPTADTEDFQIEHDGCFNYSRHLGCFRVFNICDSGVAEKYSLYGLYTLQSMTDSLKKKEHRDASSR